MKWIEMVRVRSSAFKAEEILRLIRPHMESSVKEIGKGLERVLVLVHSEYPGDLAVIMAWDNNYPPARSREALLLVDVFSKHGPVSHAVWSLKVDWHPQAGGVHGV